eukprot:1701689-Prymnesium_polylepis.1
MRVRRNERVNHREDVKNYSAGGVGMTYLRSMGISTDDRGEDADNRPLHVHYAVGGASGC